MSELSYSKLHQLIKNFFNQPLSDNQFYLSIAVLQYNLTHPRLPGQKMSESDLSNLCLPNSFALHVMFKVDDYTGDYTYRELDAIVLMRRDQTVMSEQNSPLIPTIYDELPLRA